MSFLLIGIPIIVAVGIVIYAIIRRRRGRSSHTPANSGPDKPPSDFDTTGGHVESRG